jgi:REP-associated tyrosine transposase
MSHSYLGVFVHYVFSTKHRQPWIDSSLEERLWPYVGGIARSNNMKALAIGGVSDHLHSLVSLPSKRNSSSSLIKAESNTTRDMCFANLQSSVSRTAA